jgi:ubiquitin carboxyl-terminal hydrolase 31
MFCMKINRDVSFVELQKSLLKEMSSILKPEIFSYSTPIGDMFKIHLQEPSADPGTYLESKFEHPLLTDMIDLAFSVHPSDSGPQHIKLSLEWNEPEKYFTDMQDHFVEHESLSEKKEVSQESNILTLEQCLDHYTKAEILSADDAWRCPHCQKYLPVVKTLGLWSLPDILVIHFKRFRQQQLKGSQASKLTTMVKFPLNGFDLSTWHLSSGNSGTSSVNGSLSRKATKMSSKASTLTKSLFHEDHRYDLYAVCYHQGDTLETGHYTAACKNPYDQQWYKFDDQRVILIKNDEVPEKIINNEAYMLFYQRRKINEFSESSGASTSSSEHWVSKIVTAVPSSSAAPIPVVETPAVEINAEIKNNDAEEIIEVEKDCKKVETSELEAVLDIDDIKPIDEDISEESSPCDVIAVANVAAAERNEKNVESVCANDHSTYAEKDKDIDGNDDDIEKMDVKEEEKKCEQKIEVVVEVSSSSPIPQDEVDKNETDDVVEIESNIIPKINKNSLWNDQNNNNNNNNSGSNRHSDIGGITLSDLLYMDRMEDISSTSLPKNYMLHDTERLSSRIRGVSSCSKDTLLYIDQPSLLDDSSLLDHSRSHWVRSLSK